MSEVKDDKKVNAETPEVTKEDQSGDSGKITMNEEVDEDDSMVTEPVDDKKEEAEVLEETTTTLTSDSKEGSVKVVAPEPISADEIEKAEKAEGDDKDADAEAPAPPLPTRTKTQDSLQKPGENPLLKQLKEAFPSMEEKYIKAVMIASNGALDPAFNALLFLSDPDSGIDIPLPSKEPSPALNTQSRRKLTQLEQDELLAKQLNDQYNNRSKHRKGNATSRRGRGGEEDYSGEPIPFDDPAERQLHNERVHDRRRRLQQEGEFNPETYQDDDSWGQFVERDLPEIKANVNQTIQETANNVRSWFNRNFAGDESANNNNNNNNNNSVGLSYDEEQMRQQQEALRYYESQNSHQSQESGVSGQTERRRFNSFGARIGEDSLESHGISLHNDEFSDDEDVPPQLPSRERTRESNDADADADASMVTNDDQRVVSQTTYIDTPDKTPKKKWQPVPPAPADATPTKVNATTAKANAKGKADAETDPDADADDFMINSDEE
ncbi:ubiquitin-binding protein [Maudiozyma humilis]|uniref:Ubiquitin-binding protein n=1 Tax=Maudiozyma humilis TaxID=51915 RepID=A0AAV5RPT3_MAUHU|nr:ubiquitin-binding protein [Kazachstania humilis]